jgi:hypothetical protein
MEIVQVIIIIKFIIIENMRKHFQEIIEKYGSIEKLGCTRFEMLHGAFNPSIQEIKQLTDILVFNTSK